MITQSVSELVSQSINHPIRGQDLLLNYKKKNRKNPQSLLQVSDCRYNVFIVYLRILDSLQDLPDKSRQRRIVSHAHCLTVCEKTRSHHETQPRIRGKRDVKLPW